MFSTTKCFFHNLPSIGYNIMRGHLETSYRRKEAVSFLNMTFTKLHKPLTRIKPFTHTDTFNNLVFWPVELSSQIFLLCCLECLMFVHPRMRVRPMYRLYRDLWLAHTLRWLVLSGAFPEEHALT